MNTSSVPELTAQAKSSHALCVDATRCQDLAAMIFTIIDHYPDAKTRRALGLDFSQGRRAEDEYSELAQLAANGLEWFARLTERPDCAIGSVELLAVLGSIRGADRDQLDLWTSMPWEVAEKQTMAAEVRDVQKQKRGLQGKANLDRFLRLAAILEWLVCVASPADIRWLRGHMPSPSIWGFDFKSALIVIDRLYARRSQRIDGTP